ncbi:MAG TPA: class I SAM-dependent methyltransferase [Candidatus Binataceae bacterium]|nr:class I SAM-dependent methyltransferase [Candidatus Binataceae bacterium]
MDSLNSEPVAGVLKRLFQEAAIADRPLADDFRKAGTPQEMWAQLIEAETKDYRALYRRFANNFLNVSPEFGRFLYMCARALRVRQIVEFGTSFGISTIHLACALRDSGGGKLIGTELEPEKAQRARQNLTDAALADLVEIRVGDALETLKEGIDGEIDFLLLDGAVSLYLPVLKLLESRLRDGAVVIGENAVEQVPGYLSYVRNLQNGYHSIALPFAPGRGNELTVVMR